jgi:hypothetical protein
MKGRGPVKCPPNLIGTKAQTLWIRRGAIKGGNGGGSGATGWKNRPARVLARALAEMASKYKRAQRS